MRRKTFKLLVSTAIAPALLAVTLLSPAKAHAQEVTTKPYADPTKPRTLTPELQAPYLRDSLRWRQDLKMNTLPAPNDTRQGTVGYSPQSASGQLATWRGGEVSAYATDQTMTGLMRQQGVTLNATQQYGNWGVGVQLFANRYAMPMDTRLSMRGLSSRQNQYGVGAYLTYTFNENLSATLYGRYVSNPFFYSMAAFPYIQTSAYGGFLTMHNGNVGLDLGVNNSYDPFMRRWRTDPIVRPKFNIGKMKMDVDLGPLMKQTLLHVIGHDSKQGPMIMPNNNW